MIANLENRWHDPHVALVPRIPELRSAPALEKVKVPVLAMNGALDLQVPPHQNLPAIAAALEAGGNPDYEIVKLPHLNHLFQTAQTGAPTEYAKIEETFAPAALEVLGDWIGRHTQTKIEAAMRTFLFLCVAPLPCYWPPIAAGNPRASSPTRTRLTPSCTLCPSAR
jgi:hypothetical protein